MYVARTRNGFVPASRRQVFSKLKRLVGCAVGGCPVGTTIRGLAYGAEAAPAASPSCARTIKDRKAGTMVALRSFIPWSSFSMVGVRPLVYIKWPPAQSLTAVASARVFGYFKPLTLAEQAY